VDKLNLVETYVQADELAPKDPENHNCWFCDYRYLCKDISEIQPGETIDVPEYINVALDRYSWAKEQENLVTQIKSDAAKEMVDFCKQKQVPKFQAEGYSISYRGQKTKMTLDSKGLKAKHPVIYAEFAKESNPFDDYSIRPRGK